MRLPLSIAAAVLLTSLAATLSQAQSNTPISTTWVPNGPVYAIATLNNTTYIGGNFNCVGPYTGSFVPVNANTGNMISYPKIDGIMNSVVAGHTVSAAIPDGAGGWFIGGQFTQVGGVARNGLAHMLANGSLDAGWNPNPNEAIFSLSLNGSTLYVGGQFTSIGGQPRNHVAALDATTGNPLPWNPGANNTVTAVAANGSTVYLGGQFQTVAGQPRSNLASVDSVTGAATPWNPQADNEIDAFAFSGSTVYVGGQFSGANGGGPYVAAIDSTTGLASGWNPGLVGINGVPGVAAILLNGSTVYIGGNIGSGDGLHYGIVAVDSTTGVTTDWNPYVSSQMLGTPIVNAMVLSGSTLYLGGIFDQLGANAAPRSNLAAVDALSGAILPWNPGATGPVVTLASTGTTIFAGGNFGSVGNCQARQSIAALDSSGVLTPFNPSLPPLLQASSVLTASGSTLYIGGAQIGAIDVNTGAIRWTTSNMGQSPQAMTVSGSTLYVGGNFWNINGQHRGGLAALDAASGALTAWDPEPPSCTLSCSMGITAFSINGSTMYVTGMFSSIGGQPRSHLAAVDLVSGQASSWNPTFGGGALSILASGTTVYLGGLFQQVNGQTRYGVAALNANTGTLSPWNPGLSSSPPGPPPAYGTVQSMALGGQTLYLGSGGNGIASVGGQARFNIAAVDAQTGQPAPWNPGPVTDLANTGNLDVLAMSVRGSTLTVAGDFGGIGGQSRNRLAQFTGVAWALTAKSTDSVVSITSGLNMSIAVVSTTTSNTPFAIAASSQGLTPVTQYYELSPSPVSFSPPATLTFTFNPTGIDTTTIALYRFNGVVWTSAPVTGQTITFLSPTVAQISGTLLSASLYGLFTMRTDSLPPRTTLLLGQPLFVDSGGRSILSSGTLVGFAAFDDMRVIGDGAGVGVARTEYSVDASSGPFSIFAGSFTLAEGAHQIFFRSVDKAGNMEVLHSSSVLVDATPPASSMAIGTPQFALSTTTLLVGSRTPFTIAAFDPISSGVASGVKDTWYRVSDIAPSTATFAAYIGTFTLSGADVAKVVEFFSRDNVLNGEVAKSSTVLLDATPPELALLSPGSADAGICRVLKGRFPVLGTARDLHLASYTLDAAPGRDAAGGFTLISSGTASVSSGTLGAWDASALAGWQTLRLSAADLVQNVSTISINVYIGDPVELMTLGNHEVFNMPQGVAASSAGAVYVADTNSDRVEVFSPTGTLLSSFGRRGDDDSSTSTTTLRLNKPKGVAVDAAGSLYIADAGDNRLLKLSATGQVLLDLVRRQFAKPSAVAVDTAGTIYVADTENRRIQVLSSTGALQRAIAMPPLAAARDAEDDKDDDDKTAALGKPFGVAVDAAGNVYVADAPGARLLRFDPSGQLSLSIPVSGLDKKGRAVRGRPEGVAVAPGGQCLLVSDRKSDRILKFDALGDQTLVFGAHGKRRDDAAPPSPPVFNKPIGLVLAPDGSLLVADRNNERIERFGTPTGRPTLIVPPPLPPDDSAARDVVDKDEGGKVERQDRTAVTLPAGALAQDLKISVSTVTGASLANVAPMARTSQDKGLRPGYAPVDYGPEGTSFVVPVTLTIPYDPRLLASQGVAEGTLKIHYWNPAKGDWEALDSVVDQANLLVRAKTSHFSLYQVLGSSGTAPISTQAAADGTFTFHDLYAFPNPATRGRSPTLRVQVGLADSVEIHFYDLSMKAVGQVTPGTPQVIDDGNGKGPQWTYDYTWDASGLGSGVYYYAVTAKKAGQADIRRVRKVAIVK